MLKDARYRAAKQGVPFALTEEDIHIPDICPVLGIILTPSEGRASANSPSLDRLVPSRGYVPGNVAVISTRANTLKSNASAEELAKVLTYVCRSLDATAKDGP